MSWDPAGTARLEEHRSRVCEERSWGGQPRRTHCWSCLLRLGRNQLVSASPEVCRVLSCLVPLLWFPSGRGKQQKIQFFICLSFRGLKLLLVQHLPRRAASYSLGALKPTLLLPRWAEAGAGLQNAARGLPGDTRRTSY